MDMTEDDGLVPIGKIGAALALAQMEMGPALKDAMNPAFKSKYADLASVVAACMPALNKNGIAVIQPTVSNGSVRSVRTVFIHGPSGQTLECVVDLIIGKNDMQGYGSAVTYARRYGLMCMAGIAPEDDDGNAAGQNVVQNAPATTVDAVSRAIDHLMEAETLDALGGVWKALPRHIQADPIVKKAKDEAKAALDPKPDNIAEGVPF